MIYYPFFLSSLCILVMLSLYIGMCTREHEQTTEGFLLADKRLGFGSLMLTLLATQLGGGALLGTAENATKVGLFAMSYCVSQALGLVVMGLGIGSRIRMFGITTMAALFTKRYHAPKLRTFAAWVSVLSLTGILTSMAHAARQFTFSLGVENQMLIVVCWLALVAYTVNGGLHAVVKTDAFQVVVLVSILVITTAYTWLAHPMLFKTIQASHIWEQPSLHQLVAWLAMPFFFTFVEQDIAQRCLAGKSPSTVRWSCLVAGCVLILVAMIPVYFGMIARVYHVESKGDPFMGAVMAKTNPYVAALAACGVLAAIISTADSILIAITANICEDLIPASHHKVSTAKLATAMIGALALLLSYLSRGITSTLIMSYEISVSCLTVPILMAALDTQRKYVSKAAAWGAVIAGMASFFLFSWMPCPIPKVIMTLALSLLGFLVGDVYAKSGGWKPVQMR